MAERLLELTPRFVEFVPTELEYGVLYISEKYGCAVHLCPCGCATRAAISLSSTFGEGRGWNDEGEVTLTPSLLHRFACRSHYFITRNKVVWC